MWMTIKRKKKMLQTCRTYGAGVSVNTAGWYGSGQSIGSRK